MLLTPGQASDIKSAPALLEGLSARGVIADKAYDSNALRALISEAGMAVVIPYDIDLYKTRNRIERCFNKFKHFRRISTRFDRRDIHFLAFLYLASFLIWMR